MSMMWLVDKETGRLMGVDDEQVAFVGLGGAESDRADWTMVKLKSTDAYAGGVVCWAQETPEEIKAIMEAVKLDDRYNSLATLPDAPE
jgi:hypothetical protein